MLSPWFILFIASVAAGLFAVTLPLTLAAYQAEKRMLATIDLVLLVAQAAVFALQMHLLARLVWPKKGA